VDVAEDVDARAQPFDGGEQILTAGVLLADQLVEAPYGGP
jgi:hypothetical protein